MKTAIAILLILLFTKSLPGQCPDRDFLWHRIIYLRDSSEVPSWQQLNELLSYLDKINQCSYRNDSTHALLLRRIGWLYSLQKDFSTAIEYTQKSIALIKEQKEKNNSSINPKDLISSYWNLQILYDSLKLETKKSAAIDSCISIALDLHEKFDIALNALAIKIYQLLKNGDYYSCINYANLGSSIIIENKKISDADYYEINYFSLKINSLILLHKTSDAEQLIINKIKQEKKLKSNEMLGTLYELYGLVNLANDDANKALYYFKKSFYLQNKTNHKNGCAQALNNIGFTYSTNLHQNRIAITYYLKALNFADPNESLNILDNIANVYVQDGKYDSAFYFFQKAFNQIRPGFTETDLLKTENAELRGNITEYVTGMVLDKAAAWLSKYKSTGSKQALNEAIRIYQVTDRYFDKLRISQSEIQSKLFWKTNNRRLYEQAIEACYASSNTEMALYFFEKSRSVLLNDDIMQQRKMNDADLAKQAQLKKNILETERDLQSTSSSSKEYLALQQQLFTNKQELQILLKNINSKYASFAQNNPDTISINLGLVKKKILNEIRSLIEIFNGDSAVFILSVTSNNTSLIRLNKHLYDSLTISYISYIINADKLNKDFPGFVNISHQLYKLIFQNIQLAPEGSIIISPDGKGFPFEALITNTDVRQPDYLLNHYATSYTYSATYLFTDYAANVKNRNSILGIAPVKYNSTLNLAGLPGSDISLLNIKTEFSNTTNFVFEKATKDNFLKHFPDYAIIQLYTHAADSSDRNDPVIYFADSPMYLSDLIPDRKPVTQLVILSACETANGKLYQGEGIFSFNRGFAALGIPAAISNLWSVENESTYRITELFYKYLLQGLPTDIALQKAKLEFINSTSSNEKKLPYFWAGSILTGKVEVIKSDNGFSWVKLIGATILLLAIIYFMRNIFKRKRTLIQNNVV